MRSLLAWSVPMVVALCAACGGGGGGSPSVDGGTGIPDDEHGPSVPGDIDGDGIPDEEDNCPSLANADQRDICTYRRPDAPLGMSVIEDGLARLNYHRALLGLPPVVEDNDLSQGCRLHNNYLRMLSAETGRPQLSHTEDPSKPYYTEQGNMAGINSVISLGQPDIASAVDQWINSLYHRLPLVHPGLARVGIDHDGQYGCVQYRPGTDNSKNAPHPIMWPPPDILFADRQFSGSESPCPTAPDPLGGGPCPPGGTIATLGLHGWGAMTGVSGRMTRLDTMEEVSLFRTYWDGGMSPHERSGYVEGSVALIPQPDTMLATAPYEVEVSLSLDGTPNTFRWRFHINGMLDPDIECDFFGPQGTFEEAITATEADVRGKVCDTPDFFWIRDTGTFRVVVNYDPGFGDLSLYAYDAAHSPIAQIEEGGTPLVLDPLPGMSFIEIRSRGGSDEKPYLLTIERRAM